jgi:spore germination cell wall hydrolase CwlJ-like protein
MAKIKYDAADLLVFKLVIWRESRGEGEDGMRAVGHVIVNRVGASGFPHNLHDVIYQKNAFTSISVASDPEYNLEPKAWDSQYAYITSMAEGILEGTDLDLTVGAHYYADLKYSLSGWFFRNIVQDTVNHPHTVKIGQQDFYV